MPIFLPTFTPTQRKLKQFARRILAPPPAPPEEPPEEPTGLGLPSFRPNLPFGARQIGEAAVEFGREVGRRVAGQPPVRTFQTPFEAEPPPQRTTAQKVGAGLATLVPETTEKAGELSLDQWVELGMILALPGEPVVIAAKRGIGLTIKVTAPIAKQALKGDKRIPELRKTQLVQDALRAGENLGQFLRRVGQEAKSEAGFAKLPKGKPPAPALARGAPPAKAVAPAEAAAPPTVPPKGPRARTKTPVEEAGNVTPAREPFVKGADPGPPSGKPPVTTGAKPPPKPDPADEVFERIARQRTPGEPADETLLRRHASALRTAENEARIIVEAGGNSLKRQRIGKIQRARLVPEQKDIPVLDELFEALHNPSKVASGEIRIPKGMEADYKKLRELTDWEEAMRLDFDPAMATVDDYFYRGWLPPEGLFPAGVGRGQLVAKPAFKKPRVDATYREMREAGFEPIFWNPYEQWRVSRLQGVRYRQQMQLVDDMKNFELALPDGAGINLKGWRTPKVGSAFEGKPFAAQDKEGNLQAMFSRRWVVPDSLANRLENIYGVPPNLGKLHVGNRSIDLLKAVDAVVFIPKRAKLFGSFFQQLDFAGRNFIGSWSGAIDALQAGKPLEAAKRLAVWPQSAFDIMRANIGPGARNKIRIALNSTDPIISDRPGVHLRGIMEAGMSTIDTTLLPANMDTMARTVATESGLLGNKRVMRAVGEFESAMRRGLFEGVYPSAQMSDIKNNIAPMIARQFKGETDEAINGMIARIVNKKYSTIPADQSVVQNRFLRESMRRLFFSMGESEGLLRQAVSAFKGPEAAYWRKHWFGAYVGLLAVANTIHYATTGEILPTGRWNPIGKDEYGALPVGYNRDFLSPDIPIKGTDGKRLRLDLMGQLDTAFRILDPPSFIASRESVPIRSFITQTTERDFFGKPIDRVGPAGIFSRTAQLIDDMFLPIGPGQAAARIVREQFPSTKDIIPGGEARLGTAGQLLQATGINLRTAPKGEPQPSGPSTGRLRLRKPSLSLPSTGRTGTAGGTGRLRLRR